MSNISNWSNSAGGNTAASPDGFKEGMRPSQVNDAAREVMAAVRRQWEDGQWFNWGDSVAQASATTFLIGGIDATSRYTTNRKIKCLDATTLTGHVVSATFVTDTTVTVSLGGSLTTSLSAVSLAIITDETAPTFSLSDNLTILGTLSVSGAAVMKAGLTAESTFTAVGATVLQGTLSVSGAAVMKGALTVEGTITVSSSAVFKSGVYTSGATGGDKGADTINAGAIYDDGVQIVNGLVPLGEFSGSAVATIAITSLTTEFANYDRIILKIDNMDQSAANEIGVQVSPDGGSTWRTASYLYAVSRSIAAGGVAGYGSTSASIMQFGGGSTNNSSHKWSFNFELCHHNESGHYTNGIYYGRFYSAYPTLATSNGSATYPTAETHDSLRLTVTAGTFNARVRVYGVMDS